MKILSKRLTKWADNNSVIDESQAGFRQGYSTIDNIFNLQAVIQKYLSKRKGSLYVFYIDFLKAFDNCIHEQLWKSLVRKGINPNGKLLNVFKSMYSQLRSCIKLSPGITDSFICQIGTKQGCVSSTFIFSLFINDLMAYMKQKCRHGVYNRGNWGNIWLNVCR